MQPTALRRANSSRRFLFHRVAGSSTLLLAAVAFGCGRPFNVKSQPDLPPARYAAKATVDAVTVAAQAITDEDFLYDTFDANLISAGVLPIRVMLTNSSAETVDLKNARFEVQSGTRRFKGVNAQKAFKRLISYYGISAYSKSGYRESLEAFSAYALDLTTPLGGSQSRQGLVFVLMPEEAARETGLTMVIAKLNGKQDGDRGSVALKLN